LVVLNPLLVTVYKYALAGKRIVRFSFLFIAFFNARISGFFLSRPLDLPYLESKPCTWRYANPRRAQADLQLIYSPPPLLPLAAFAYCIQAMSLAPPSAPDAAISKWIGNVGLMDLDAVKKRQGGWIGSTLDGILLLHSPIAIANPSYVRRNLPHPYHGL